MPPVPLSRHVAALLCSLALLGAALTGCAARPTQTAKVTSTPTAIATVTPTDVPPTPTGVPVGWTDYQDPTYHFALYAPASWSVTTSNPGFYEFQDTGLAPDGSSAWLIVFITDSPNKYLGEMQFCTSAKTTTMAGFPAVVADHSRSANSSAPPALARLFVANGLFYEISLSHISFDTEPLDMLQQSLGPLFEQLLALFQPGPGEPGNVICPS